MEAAAEELEVVRHCDERPCRDEHEQPETRAYRDHDADCGRAGQRSDGKSDECRVADPRLEGSSVQLVESMGADAHAEKEREQSQAEHVGLEMGSKPRSDRDVREMPERVRRM